MTRVVSGMAEPLAFKGRTPAATYAVRGGAVQRYYLALLAIILGYGVYSAGGRDFIEWTVCLFAIGLVALVYWLQTNRLDMAPVEPWLVWAVVLPSAYVALQLVPLPMGVLSIISPARAELAGILGAVTRPPSFASLSINPAVTLSYLLNIIGYTLTFLLVRDIAHRSQPRASSSVVLPLVLLAALEAGLGLVQATDGAVALGTYRNRNHLAGLLEMALPMTVACGAALIFQRDFTRRGLSIARALAAALVFVAAGLIFAGLVFTSSKMGFVAALCGLFVMGTLAVATTLRSAKKWASLAGIALVCLAVFVLVPTDQVVGGFGNILSGSADQSEGRWPVAQDAVHLLEAYPLFGSGFGTFGTAFLKHQTALIELDFTFAHNDYLELATEVGAAGFSIFIGLMLVVFVKAIRAAAHGHDWHTRALGLGCSGAIVAIAVHSLSDFNMYIPANPLFLAWISGIAVSLPGRSSLRTHASNRERAHREASPQTDQHEPRDVRRIFTRRPLRGRGCVFFQASAIVLAAVLVLYAGGRILLEHSFRGRVQAERLFCAIGICDIDAVLAAQAQPPSGAPPSVTVSALTEAVGRDAAAPYRWCDLAEAMVKADRVEEARRCFSNALALGPNVPPNLLRAAYFYEDLGEHQHALALASRVLAQTTIYDSGIFNWYRVKKMPAADILANGLPSGGERASREYLRYLMITGDFNNAAVAWDWLLGRRYADASVARDYVGFLYQHEQYEDAARSWARYLDDHRNGYLDSTQLFNGGFESDPSGSVFDWHIENLGDDVIVASDATVAHGGAHSLELRFAGNENVDYHQTYQTIFVKPGEYRFEAFVRAQGITTNQGIRFRLSGSGLDVTTDQVAGTSDWICIQQTVRVPDGTKLLTVQVVRQKSLKFDSHIAGTAWVDDVRLSRIQGVGSRE